MAANDLTAECLRRLTTYNPLAGTLHSIRRPYFEASTCLKPLGYVHRQTGYVQVSLFGMKYTAHRLVWLHVHGEWPAESIDHINGDRTDNRVENLRDVSARTNRENQRAPNKNGSSGFLGVRTAGTVWAAQIRSNGVAHTFSRRDSAEVAAQDYIEAKRKLHKGCTI